MPIADYFEVLIGRIGFNCDLGGGSSGSRRDITLGHNIGDSLDDDVGHDVTPLKKFFKRLQNGGSHGAASKQGSDADRVTHFDIVS